MMYVYYQGGASEMRKQEEYKEGLVLASAAVTAEIVLMNHPSD